MSYKAHMYGDRESHSGIVPAKRSNAGQGGPKEIAEGRPLTMENAAEPNSHRTLRRNLRAKGAEPRTLGEGTVGVQPSQVRTVCVRSASTDLCGGCRATGIPTANSGLSGRQLWRIHRPPGRAHAVA